MTRDMNAEAAMEKEQHDTATVGKTEYQSPSEAKRR